MSAFSLLIPSAFLLSERWGGGFGEREIGRGGSCNSEWTALHWQDKIRIDSLITASLSKQQRQRERDREEGERMRK